MPETVTDALKHMGPSLTSHVIRRFVDAGMHPITR